MEKRGEKRKSIELTDTDTLVLWIMALCFLSLLSLVIHLIRLG